MENCHGQADNSDILYEFHDEVGEVFDIELGNNCENIVASPRMSPLSASEGIHGNCLHVRRLPLSTRIFPSFLQ